MNRTGTERGFTLIEVLVAFVIFALSVGAVFEVFAGATRRAERARDTEQLWLTAQSIVSELRVRAAPWPSQMQGNTGTSGESWTFTAEPFDAGVDPKSPWKAYLVSVHVKSLSTQRAVTLRTVEMAGALQ